MTVTSATSRNLDFPFTAADFDRIAAFAHEKIGLHLEKHKQDLVYGRLAKRLRSLGLKSFGDYFDFLTGPQGEVEQRELLNVLTTNVTHFFRENHHFDHMRNEVLPKLIARARSGQKVRLWSAGCSAGQEAYSIALTISELCPDASRLDLRILATDVDRTVLKKANAARYPEMEMTGVPPALRQSGFTAKGDASFVIRPEVRNLVTFGELNLIKPWPMRGQFDVIFCRNVAIYFDKPTQEKLWARFAKVLREGGHLMIGHSERVTGPGAETLRNGGVTTYIKMQAQ